MAPTARNREPGAATPRGVVRLLGQFGVECRGAPVEVPAGAQRLVAFLALEGREVERSYVSSRLWMDKSEERAGANLRSALWRLRQCPAGLVTVSLSHVRLGPEYAVDVTDMLARARALIDGRAPMDDAGLEVGDLARDLLPAWYDDFVELERERFRQLRLHALEALARRHLLAARPARALDAALTALAADPLRESAHRAVMEVHLAEGNVAEAVRQFGILTSVLAGQLGIAPSARTRALLAEHRGGGRQAAGGEIWLPPTRPAPSMRAAVPQNRSRSAVPSLTVRDDARTITSHPYS